MRNGEENGVIHKTNTQYDSLEFITMSKPDTKISIYLTMTVDNRSNEYPYVDLYHFIWWCNVLVLWSVCHHVVFFVKLRGLIMFQKFMECL